MRAIKCKTCRRSFKPKGIGRAPKYCSAACRQKAYRKRPVILRLVHKQMNERMARRAALQTALERLEMLERLGYTIEIWGADFHYRTPPGGVPEPLRPSLRIVQSPPATHADPSAPANP